MGKMAEQLRHVGVNENVRDVGGTKLLEECSCTEKLWRALLKDRLPKSRQLNRCRAEVRASGTVVWPLGQSNSKEPDLRASNLEILAMSEADDAEIPMSCTSGKPRFYSRRLERYYVGQKYSGYVNEDASRTCVEGFHFWMRRTQ